MKWIKVLYHVSWWVMAIHLTVGFPSFGKFIWSSGLWLTGIFD